MGDFFLKEKQNFNLSLNIELAEKYKSNYNNWRKRNFDYKLGYFILFQSFKDKDILKDISGGALKLYLFLGTFINNNTGECWVTINRASEYFENDPRTISKWLKELESLNLRSRIQFKPKEPAHTYFKPY